MSVLLPTGLAVAAATRAGPLDTLASQAELRFLVTTVPGGATDLLARTLAQSFAQLHKLPVVVLNVEGAAGEIALRRLATDAPDGRTWLLTQESVITINPSYYTRASLDVLDGIVPVGQVATNSFYMLVRADDGIGSFKDFVQEARQARAPLPYGSGGVGSLHHLSMEDLSARLQLQLLHVPYKGNALAAQALVRGEIRVLLAGISTVPLVQAGRLTMIAVTAPKRVPAYPDVPALNEFVPGFEPTAWFGFFARKGVPDSVVADMRALLRRSLENEEMRHAVRERAGVQLAWIAGTAFVDQIMADRQRYAAAAQRLGAPKLLDAGK